MKLIEILNIMQDIADKNKISTPMICGGTVRDKIMGNLNNISDLDITTGDKKIEYLVKEFSIFLSDHYNYRIKTMSDGHSSIFLGNIKIDFSSNFVVPNIENILKRKNISNPTDMQKELFSRDFTCNSLLMSLDLKNIYDPTNMGFEDIKNKIIKTCLSPEITLTSNKNRVIRTIYLATKLDFDVDPSIINWVRNNPESVKLSSQHTLVEKLNLSLDYNTDKTIDLINRMNLWNYIPINEKLYPYYMKSGVK